MFRSARFSSESPVRTEPSEPLPIPRRPFARPHHGDAECAGSAARAITIDLIMRTHFAFGKTGLTLDLPEGFQYKLLEARSASPLPDQPGAIEAAMDAPIAGPGLRAWRRKEDRRDFGLRYHASGAEQAGVAAAAEATACGRDRARERDDSDRDRSAPARDARPSWMRSSRRRSPRLIGSSITMRANCPSTDSSGNTKSGTPVYVAEDFVAADLHITLGFIEPHLMAGFSGARKLVAPGLAAQETIKVLHSPKFMRDPKAVEGSIEGNPLHRELLEIAQMAGHHFMVDVALDARPADRGRLRGRAGSGARRRHEVRIAR